MRVYKATQDIIIVYQGAAEKEVLFQSTYQQSPHPKRKPTVPAPQRENE